MHVSSEGNPHTVWILSDLMKAVTAMVRELRRGNGRYGLILANGGVLTYQHVVCLSSKPRGDDIPYPERNPLPDYLSDIPLPPIDASPEGEATIEVGRLYIGLLP